MKVLARRLYRVAILQEFLRRQNILPGGSEKSEQATGQRGLQPHYRLVSAHASTTDPVSVLAIFVADDGTRADDPKDLANAASFVVREQSQ